MAQIQGSGADKNLFYVEGSSATGGTPMIRADLSNAVASTINSLRQAFQLQRLMERDQRGTRYVELIKSHFGVISPDFRLQRSEYLGGGSSPIIITPVTQNTPSSTTPLGHLGAIGTAGCVGHGFNKSFTEHGVLLGLINVRIDNSYQHGIPRCFSRRSGMISIFRCFRILGNRLY